MKKRIEADERRITSIVRLLIEPAALMLVLIGCVAVAGLLTLFDPMQIGSDTAQHISVARHLVAGQGFKTDLVSFQQQLDFGSMPAPQTVWPPLYAILIAALILVGVSPYVAAVFWSAAPYVCIAPLVYVCARAASYRVNVAAGAGFAAVAFVSIAFMIPIAYSEPLFTAVSLLALLALLIAVRDGEPVRRIPLFVAGALTGLAFLTRYTGITVVAALCVWAGVHWLRRPSIARALDGLSAVAPPVLLVVGSLLRNYLATGSASGGPNVSFEPSARATAYAFYWAVGKLFGFTEPTAFAPIVLIAAVGLAAFLVVRVLRWVARFNAADKVGGYEAGYAGNIFALANVLLSVGLVVVLSITRYPDFLTERYLIPLWPFVVLVFVFAISPARCAVGRAANIERGVLGVLAAILLLGQAAITTRELHAYDQPMRARRIVEFFNEPMTAPDGTGTTVGAFLHSAASYRSPLLEMEADYLNLALQRPVLGLPEIRFTHQVWDEHAVRTLAERYGVRYLVFLPREFRPDALQNRNQPLHQALFRGNRPAWLVPLHSSDRVQIFRIE